MTMPTNAGSAIDYWGVLSIGADTGEFMILPDTARELNVACESYIDALRANLNVIESLTLNGAMGSLESGRQLEAKFSQKAMGGERSLEDVFLEHIAVIQSMQAFFQKFFTDVGSQDSENSSFIAQTSTR